VAGPDAVYPVVRSTRSTSVGGRVIPHLSLICGASGHERHESLGAVLTVAGPSCRGRLETLIIGPRV
jgi:hypothetical protein